MTPQRYQLVKRIFLDVCNSDESNRIAVLERECGDDFELRTEVESLLNQDSRSKSTGFLERPAINSAMFWNGDPPAPAPHSPTALHNGAAAAPNGAHAQSRASYGSSTTTRRSERIGQYRILDTLGEGGMRMVYLAEQDKPRRKVALKVIRPGIVSEPVMRRFEYEANLLGRLHHPGIAQIYEAGTADTGLGPQPFFAMELINGVSLRQYAKDVKLTVRQRLELLARVCDAVHHAHQKGIIHRDLKPANILVEDEEGIEASRHQGNATLGASTPRSLDASLRGQPKILDFGVARATHSDPAETMRTNAGALIGTISYMSPEQIAADPHDLDTRSDVYSLGVIYYEMLCDEHPLNLTGCTIAECARIIRDEDITPLSARDKSLRGDLETIVHKALEKDRTRRYQSALELAADTRRLLDNQTITARPPNTVYQVRKFVQRNRVKVLLATVIFCLTPIMIWLYGQASAQRTAKISVADSYANLMKANLKRPEGSDTLTPSSSDKILWESASVWVDQNWEDLPLNAAELADLIAQNYLLMYDTYGDAQRYADLALSFLARLPKSPETESAIAASLHTRGRALWSMGQFVHAEQEYRHALSLWETTVGAKSREATMTMQHIAACLRDQGRFDDAIAMANEALDLRLSFLKQSDLLVAANIYVVGSILEKQGRFVDAAEKFETSIESIRNLTDDLRVARTKCRVAACWIKSGDKNRFADAGQYLADALKTEQQSPKGRENPMVAETLREMARLCKAQGNPEQAADYCQQALNIQQTKLGIEHSETNETRALLQEIMQTPPADAPR